MSLVGTLAPWRAGQYSNVAADATRGVAYLGSWDEQGVAVIDTRDPAHPMLTDHLSTHIQSAGLRSAAAPDATGGDLSTAHLEETSDSADLDLVGRYLAVSHQDLTFTDPPIGFEGISIYDTASDPYHPTLLRRIAVPGGVHTVQIDPEAEHGRPYAYANSAGNYKVTVVNILTGETLAQYASSEGIGCAPDPSFCIGFNFAHEGFIQRHPRSGRVLDYVSYWDSGLRIVDVTDPRAPAEVGAYDYDFSTNRLRAAHYAAPTPSGDWVYLEDEIGYLQAGGVHVLDTSACDGTAPCTPVLVGGWDLPGRDVQTASIHKFFRHPNFNGSFLPILNRSFIYDAHNLDVRGENTLLVANYGMGIRLIDTSDKAAPSETAFYLPNANMDESCKMECYFVGRQTWGSHFGSDGLIYASDLSLGFFIVDPAGSGRGVARGPAAYATTRGAVASATILSGLRVARAGSGYEISFASNGDVPASAAVYDVTGRRVARIGAGGGGAHRSPQGVRMLHWDGRGESGTPLARGIYFVRAEMNGAVRSGKLVHLGDR
ncbi:MAG: hypothetical protein AABZ94_09540 [Candidatus Eisenbacteria bacterium]